MLAIKLRSNLRQFSKGLDDFHRRQVPYAAARAINAIAEGARGDIVKSMQETFDQPTPYTLRATYIKRARKTDLVAFIGIREFAGKGTPAWKYLDPQRAGGARRQKRFERRLQATNRAAAYAVPGTAARLDKYGNLSSAQLNQVLAALGGFSDTGANATAASKAKGRRRGRADYFIARSKRDGRPLAVLQRKGRGKPSAVLVFKDQAPRYQARWPIGDIVLESIGRRRAGAFERAWAEALATAR